MLITPIKTNDPNNAVEQLKKCVNARQPNLLITVLTADSGLNIEAGQVIRFTNEAELKKIVGRAFQPAFNVDVHDVLKARQSKIIKYESCTLFLEFIPPTIKIIIMGGNYDVYPLLNVIQGIGWYSVVVTNPRRLAKNIHQIADEVVTDFREVVIDNYTVAIIMSHDYNADLRNLKLALASDLMYIGLLGPASRKNDMLAELSYKVNKTLEDRLFGPAGLDIGASQPEEIAISIVSEILSVIRQRPGTSLKNRQGPIYER